MFLSQADIDKIEVVLPDYFQQVQLSMWLNEEQKCVALVEQINKRWKCYLLTQSIFVKLWWRNYQKVNRARINCLC